MTMLYLIMIVITIRHQQSPVLETPHFIITVKIEEQLLKEYLMTLVVMLGEQPLAVAEYLMTSAQTLEQLGW